MSLREKYAWINFLVTFIGTIGYIALRLSEYIPREQSVKILLLFVFSVMLVQVILYLVASRTSPLHSRGDDDDREKLILLRSQKIGYYVLIVLVLLMFFTGHMTFDTAHMILHGLLAIVVSLMIKSISQIILFRTS